ncbi:MAG TPA: amino acid permease, partial [Pirellulaceae bacterium]
MIGAGIFTTSGFSLQQLGTPQRVLWAWVIAGGVALCGAISYGQLVRIWPESGGEYLFLARGLHPVAGFIAGWISLVAGFSGAIALAAMGLAAYVCPQGTPGERDAVAIVAVIVAAL